jgi:hypothetical protein
MELVGFDTLLPFSTTLNEMRIDLAWSCVDASNAKWYAVDPGARMHESSIVAGSRISTVELNSLGDVTSCYNVTVLQ